ncbi:MAG: hypothetical protein JW937_06055 [Candidatus Omnitrophica bacterium]|nr:hypothetical protein [Candidatus Omnitrophota bacterium]
MPVHFKSMPGGLKVLTVYFLLGGLAIACPVSLLRTNSALGVWTGIAAAVSGPVGILIGFGLLFKKKWPRRAVVALPAAGYALVFAQSVSAPGTTATGSVILKLVAHLAAALILMKLCYWYFFEESKVRSWFEVS